MTPFDFKFASNPVVYFGAGKFKVLPRLINGFGPHVLLVTGADSFKKNNRFQWLLKAFKNSPTQVYFFFVQSEPSPELIDEIVRTYHDKQIHVVVAIGGGSVLDTGKAVSAMLTRKEPVSTYLEGVGTKPYAGKKISFIAVPTTAGTGSEATQNAVLTCVGENGFKKSLRHETLVPDIAVVDPELTLSCPPDITAACGMDAVTQLIESYVSVNASPMTDSLALGGLSVLGDALLRSVVTDPTDLDARTRMCYGSYVSGLTLANAGLGAVHGFAAVIGGHFSIPHGVICGTLVAQVTQKNIKTLIRKDPKSKFLVKYATLGKVLGKSNSTDTLENAGLLSDLLMEWTKSIKIPLLGHFGVTGKDVDKIVSATAQKSNPVTLTPRDLKDILNTRI
ncbi:MAG: iron-containing alcohol dehydrogenase [Proteobacteria bacterium]|nr:iron-containing alcohol dehydrogenase [Desulfobacula sp.]MBU4131706.1 iron-containing alcohol dehydrogenase [Pseudomonadota bacterium]